ncbi:methionine ABC transporter ATP-binding protein [Limosilactobacillus fermentum]|uniref:methionine ABC transporter ATP-binding protein n=1 Tax=Limosilactobacillus fermentum TaxID=1613 RepID=UPI0023E3E104|nr:methionine ABC transporter ATP-binding protein [Limosilactobacillus fermentum]MDF4006918.1 methionine ABC transporter ATP-binding protein [Limosilactobacillus fermentum]MDF4015884.1 methionine ABC transporter ATP-binding protein [Limosilactobacillus fermentum]
MSGSPIISLKNISVEFQGKGRKVDAVHNVSLKVNKGDVFGVIGYSGAGKSTLARTINLLQKPTNGSVTISGQNIGSLPAKDLRQARKKIGMIFQHFNLMNTRTVEDNVILPLLHSGLTKKEQYAKADELLQLVGLETKKKSYPRQLSGGQKQRVAIARSLANDPEILISDEATSALDPQTTRTILDILQKLNKQMHLTIILITHEMDVIKNICNKLVVLDKGEIVERGDLLDVFVHPQQQLTQEFVGFHAENRAVLENLDITNKQVIEITYDATAVPDVNLGADLSAKYGKKAKIAYSNSEFIDKHIIKNSVLIINGDQDPRVIIEYFKQHEFDYHIIKGGEQFGIHR